MVKLKAQKRGVAHKVWLSDIYNGQFVRQEGWAPNYIEVNGKKISRINIIATVVGKFLSEDGNYGSITLDDGTETIRGKAFGPDVLKLKSAKISSIVRVIGKVKEYNDEVYVSPEVIRELEDPNWIIVHKLEIGQPTTTVKSEEMRPSVSEDVAEEIIKGDDESIQKKLLSLIRTLDEGEGADINAILASSELDEEETKNILIGLLKSGDIFEPKKGRLKILD